MDIMKATRCERVEYSPMSGPAGGHGYRAPGAIVMVIREGTGWVMSQDGTTEAVSAVTVITWSAGDWVSYGSDGSGAFAADLYWATDMSDDERAASLSETFGS